jgi:hypothetical protein
VIRLTGERRNIGENSRSSGYRLAEGLPEMTETAFSALVRAWATTVIAISVFIAALALARTWDSSIYLHGLQQALTLDV